MGTNDLAKELGAAHTPDRLPLVASLGLCLLAARAEGLVCVDGVFNAFQDQEGLRAACVQGREMGFDGKTLIHPDQIAVANEVFAPSADDLALAGEQVAAFEAAEARGEGVAVVNGRIVENLHVATARRLLARAAAIAELEAAHDASRPRADRSGRSSISSSASRRARARRMDAAMGAGPARGVIAALLVLGDGADGRGLPAGAVRAGLRPAGLGDPPQQPADARRRGPAGRGALQGRARTGCGTRC